MKLDWTKGLLPAVIQDEDSRNILMVGYMNEESLAKTIETRKVTFYSRSKARLWTKGESSGNFLNLVKIKKDCDSDSILITARPVGATCHTGERSCFDDFSLSSLEKIINDRYETKNIKSSQSYTASLLCGDEDRLIQKVGEEAVEVVLASKKNKSELKEEMADLLFHSMVLLKRKGLSLWDIEQILRERHLSNS